MVARLHSQREGGIVEDVEDSHLDAASSDNDVAMYGSRDVTVFHSAAVDSFKQREYQGLVYETAEDDASTTIHNGLHGTARSYKHL
jgi:hypothetical protein